MTPEEVKKLQLLKMTLKCKKSRKRKPRRVAKPVLKIEGSVTSYDFPVVVEDINYRGTASAEVRSTLRKIVDASK